MKLSIRMKIIGSLALIIGAMAIIGWQSVEGLKLMQQNLASIQEGEFFRTQVIGSANIDLLAWDRLTLSHILSSSPERRVAYERDMAKRVRSLEDELKSLAANSGLSGRGAEIVNQAQAELAQALPVQAKVIALSKQDKDADARKLQVAELAPRVDRIVASLEEGRVLQREELKKVVTSATQRYDDTSRRIWAVLLVALFGAIVIGYLLASGIVTGINQAVSLSKRVAVGDLAAEIPDHGREDEIGDLMRSFGEVIESSRDMAAAADRIADGDLRGDIVPRSERDLLGKALAGMSVKLREQIGEIVEGANVLAASSAEILAATTQLAASTSEMATAVTQTATTMEEVRQTAQVASDKTQQIAGDTQSVIQVAEQAGTDTSDAIEGIGRIREQTEAISESVLRLSEQSQSIGEIISSVEDLADQSNILAVNASIEAVRAGEEGRAFGVVAEEIRSLSEQSKKATAQVRNILNDVRKATSASVMAAEQGTKAVEVGVAQSTRAGDAMRALVEGASQAVRATTQIAASSQQQLAGVDQVALAMDNIKQASAQNAASTRQAEEAARNLSDLGEKLRQVVVRYRV